VLNETRLGLISVIGNLEKNKAIIKYIRRSEKPTWQGEGHTVIGENRYHLKLSFIRGSSPDFTDGKRKQKFV
jgi:hypothetical protein